MKSVIVILAMFFAVVGLTQGRDASLSIEVIPTKRQIRVGEPFIFQLCYRFQEQQVSSKNGHVRQYFRHNAYLDIEHEKPSLSTIGYKLFPTDLRLKDGRGREYYRNFSCFYHPGEERLLFPVPGKYTIKVRGWKTSSERLDIHVKQASRLQQQALSLLSDPDDYIFLEAGDYEYKENHSEGIDHLRQVVDQCGDTLLGKWAAARLGIENSRELERKYRDGEKFWADYREGRLKEPLLDQARSNLSQAARLPDEFPIREEVLYELPKMEMIEGHYNKALSLLDELARKYPSGEYGRRAEKAKEQLLQVMEREAAPLAESRPRYTLLVVTLGILAGAAVILAVYLAKTHAARSK